MSTIVNKKKINEILNQRENVADVSKRISNLENQIETKLTYKTDKVNLIKRLDDKIDNISQKKVIAEMKTEGYKYWFDIYNIFILILSAFLTIVEVIKNEVDMETTTQEIENFFKIFPILISSLIGFVTAIIKFKRYQDKLENNTKAIEKSNFTMFRMKKIQEDLHFADDEEFLKIKGIYKEEIYPLYNQCQEDIESNLLHKDIIKFASIKKDIENKGQEKLLKLKIKEKALLDKAYEEKLDIDTIHQMLRLSSDKNKKLPNNNITETLDTTDSESYTNDNISSV